MRRSRQWSLLPGRHASIQLGFILLAFCFAVSMGSPAQTLTTITHLSPANAASPSFAPYHSFKAQMGTSTGLRVEVEIPRPFAICTV